MTIFKRILLLSVFSFFPTLVMGSLMAEGEDPSLKSTTGYLTVIDLDHLRTQAILANNAAILSNMEGKPFEVKLNLAETALGAWRRVFQSVPETQKMGEDDYRCIASQSAQVAIYMSGSSEGKMILFRESIKYWKLFFQYYLSIAELRDYQNYATTLSDAALCADALNYHDEAVGHTKASSLFWGNFLKKSSQETLLLSGYVMAGHSFFNTGMHVSLAEKGKWFLKAAESMEQYFLRGGDGNNIEYLKLATRSYANAGNHAHNQKFSRMATTSWSHILAQFPDSILPEDYGNAAAAFNNEGFNLTSMLDKVRCFTESAAYWSEFLKDAPENVPHFLTSLKMAANAFNKAAYYADDRSSHKKIFLKKSLESWQKFFRLSAQTEIDAEDYRLAACAYTNAGYDLDSKYFADATRLANLGGVEFAYEVGDYYYAELREAKEEQTQMLKQREVEEQKESCDVDDQEEVIKEILKIKKKKRNKRKKILSGPKIEAPEATLKEGAVSSKEEQKDDSVFSNDLSSVAVKDQVLAAKSEDSAFIAPEDLKASDSANHTMMERAPKIPLRERKLKDNIEKAIKRRSDMAVQDLSSEKEMSKKAAVEVSASMRDALRQVYDTPQKQQKVLNMIDNIISLKEGRTIEDHQVISFLKKLVPMRVSGDDVQEYTILGHYYNPHFAHGSRQGTWDKGMIHNLVDFARNVRATFEEIIR